MSYNNYMSFQELQKNQLVRIFNAAVQSGKIDENEFAKWQVNASSASWRKIQTVWIELGRPDELTWPFLKNQILLFTESSFYTALETLQFFLQLPSKKDTWLHKQTCATQSDIYTTCEQWLIEETRKSADDPWILLNIAIATQSMPAWRVSALACRESLDFNQALGTLNVYANLDVEDIKALSDTNVLSETMALCIWESWNHVAECIERYNDALEGMKEGSLDAWALREYFEPSATFETTFSVELEEYRDWAHQWWFSCVLGPTQESALAMVRSITKEVRPNLSIDVPESMFEVAQ